MKKIFVIRIVSFLLALSLVLFGVILEKNNEKNSVSEKLNEVYRRSFDTLVMCVDEINSAIEKIQYASSKQQIANLSEHILNQAAIAENELKKLPQSSQLKEIIEFLEKVEKATDELYVMQISEENKDEIISEFSEDLNALAEDFRSSLSVYGSENGLDEINNSDDLGSIQFEDMLEKVKDNEAPKATENKDEITLNKGLLIVNNLFGGMQINDSTEKTGGNLPLLIYGSENFYVTLTKQGGLPLFLSRERNVNENNIRKGRAVEFADDFLKKSGFLNMVNVYTVEKENSFKLYYAYLEGATICYADLVVLNIAKDNGEVIKLDAFEYIYNHTPRTLVTPTYSVEDAFKMISSNLTVLSSASVLLPKSSKNEIRCYEFLCEGNDKRKVLLYLNAETLAEEALVLVDE